MALQSSGAISISEINAEVTAIDSTSLTNLSTAVSFTAPHAMSEFYGYSASTTVYINAYIPNYAGCYNYYTFAATATNASATSSIPVNTTLTVSIGWNGDLGGYFSGYLYITAGSSCGSTGAYSGGIYCGGEYVSIVNWSISPQSSGNQSYVSNIDFYGTAPC
jgi:hypothetical protein